MRSREESLPGVPRLAAGCRISDSPAGIKHPFPLPGHRSTKARLKIHAHNGTRLDEHPLNRHLPQVSRKADRVQICRSAEDGSARFRQRPGGGADRSEIRPLPKSGGGAARRRNHPDTALSVPKNAPGKNSDARKNRTKKRRESRAPANWSNRSRGRTANSASESRQWYVPVSRLHLVTPQWVSPSSRRCLQSSRGLKTPTGVMMPVIKSAGVTSKPGLRAPLVGLATRT